MTTGGGMTRLLRLLCALVLLGVVSACTTDDDENPDETPTQPAGAPATPTRPPLPLATTAPTQPAGDDDEPPPAATLDPARVQQIDDGLCQATLPDNWDDDGSGRGATPSGARFELFGNRIAGDDAWQRAVALIESQAERREGTEVSRGDDFIRLDFPNGAGFVYRARFADRYCDIGVESRRGPVPDPERAVWDAIIASLGPAA